MSNCSWKKKLSNSFFKKTHTGEKCCLILFFMLLHLYFMNPTNFIINHYDIYLIFCLAHQNGCTIIHIIKCDFIEEKCKVLLFHTVQTI